MQVPFENVDKMLQLLKTRTSRNMKIRAPTMGHTIAMVSIWLDYVAPDRKVFVGQAGALCDEALFIRIGVDARTIEGLMEEDEDYLHDKFMVLITPTLTHLNYEDVFRLITKLSPKYVVIITMHLDEDTHDIQLQSIYRRLLCMDLVNLGVDFSIDRWTRYPDESLLLYLVENHNVKQHVAFLAINRASIHLHPTGYEERNSETTLISNSVV